MNQTPNDSTFEVTEKGFDFLCPKITRLPSLKLSITEERDVPINKKDLWGKDETVTHKKYFTVNLSGLNTLDQKTLKKVQFYVAGSQGEEWNADEELNQKYIKTETLLKYVILAYVAQGKFVTKNNADAENLATVKEAASTMLDMNNKTWVHKKLKLNVGLRQEAEELLARVTHWLKKMDFVEFSKLAPDWEDYFVRLNEVSKAKVIDMKKANYVGGLLQTFLRFEKEKIREEKGKGYVGMVGQSILFRGNVIVSKSLIGCRKFEAHLYIFQDLSGNIIKWVTSKKDGIDVGTIRNVSARVKSHQVDTFTKQPTTIITHAILEQI